MNFLYTIQPFHAPNFIGRMSPVEKEIPRWIAFETIENKSPSAHSMGDQYSLAVLENSCDCPVVTAHQKHWKGIADRRFKCISSPAFKGC